MGMALVTCKSLAQILLSQAKAALYIELPLRLPYSAQLQRALELR